jgi:hypothetical protein
VTAQPIQVVEARSADQVLTGVEAAAKAGAPGLLTLEDALLVSTRRQKARVHIASRRRGGRVAGGGGVNDGVRSACDPHEMKP